MKKLGKLGLIIAVAVLSIILGTMLFACKKPDNGNNDTDIIKTVDLTFDEIDELLVRYDYYGKEFSVTNEDVTFFYKPDSDGGTASHTVQSSGTDIRYAKSNGNYYRYDENTNNPTKVRLSKGEYIAEINDLITKYTNKNIISSYISQEVDAYSRLGTAYFFGDECNNAVFTAEKRVRSVNLVDTVLDYKVSKDFTLVSGLTLYRIVLDIDFDEQGRMTSFEVEIGPAPASLGEAQIASAQKEKYNYGYANVSPTAPSSEPALTTTDKVTISFSNCNQMSSVTVAAGSEYTLPVLTMADSSAVFVGWYYDSSLITPVEENFKTGYFGERTLYAKWSTPEVDVEFNDSIPRRMVSTKDLFSIGSVVRALNTTGVFKAGYVFDGWYLDDSFLAEAAVISTKAVSSDLKLYAKFTKAVEITLEADVSYALPKVIGKPDTKLNLPIGLDKKGYFFAGWYSDSAKTVPVGTKFPQSNATYYAKFEPANMISFDKTSYGDWESDLDFVPPYICLEKNIAGPDAAFVALYKNISQPLVGKTIGNDVFAGWYTDAALTTPFKSYPTGNITLYAKFAPEIYLQLDGCEGDIFISDTSIPVYSNRAMDYSSLDEKLAEMQQYIVAPSKKSFDKWYTDQNRTVVFDGKWPESTMTLYAGYVDTKAIFFDLSNPLCGNYNQLVFDDYENMTLDELSQNVTLEKFRADIRGAFSQQSGYYLEGWYTDAAFSNKFTFEQYPSAQTTLYPKFLENFDVTTNAANETNIDGCSMVEPFSNAAKLAAWAEAHDGDIESYFDSILTIEPGYEFIGWFSDAEALTEFDFGDIMKTTGSVSVYYLVKEIAADAP